LTRLARWPRPQPGDIVWCRFPQDLVPRPGPKPRRALVLAVGDIEGDTAVEVAFGTSQRTHRLHRAEFLIGPDDGDAFRIAGLSHPNQFDLAKRLELPCTSERCAVAPGIPCGQAPGARYDAGLADMPKSAKRKGFWLRDEGSYTVVILRMIRQRRSVPIAGPVAPSPGDLGWQELASAVATIRLAGAATEPRCLGGPGTGR
jgi:hypothetical protein